MRAGGPLKLLEIQTAYVEAQGWEEVRAAASSLGVRFSVERPQGEHNIYFLNMYFGLLGPDDTVLGSFVYTFGSTVGFIICMYMQYVDIWTSCILELFDNRLVAFLKATMTLSSVILILP